MKVIVPNGDGEHSTETGEHCRALLGKEREYDLCVAGGAEVVALCGELIAELEVVVDFAVENERVAPARGVHGLVGTGGGIEDGEAGVGEEEPGRGIAPEAVSVRSATSQGCENVLRDERSLYRIGIW